jgi:CubicO group peptidase (beta-lactamase class C family)
MKFVATLAGLLIIAATGPGAPPELEGDWEGPLALDPLALTFEVSFSADGDAWGATLSVPAEGVRGVPIGGVELDDNALTMTLTPQRTFRGAVDGDSIVGAVTFGDRGGMEAPLTLYRVGSPAWSAYRESKAEDDAGARGFQAIREGPAADRVDPDALASLVSAAAASRSSAMVIMHDGELVGSWLASGESHPIEAMSATKSVVNLAVGRLLTTGRLESLDTPVHQFYPSWSRGAKSRVTVRHLMNHTSGLVSPLPTNPIYESGDFVTFALESELASEPGAVFEYNNSATNLLAGVIGEVAGRRMDLLLRDEIFRPLGIGDATWSLDEAGNPHGMAGLQIHPEDLAKLGQLVLQRGEWQGERLIDETWFERSLSPGSEHNPAAGLLWWLIRDGAAEEDDVAGALASGFLGQYLVIYPEERLVGVRMIEGGPGYDPDRDGFGDFPRLLRTLGR